MNKRILEHAFNFADALIRKKSNSRCYCVGVEE